jgi:single-stranded-DNA-specific exonuclease
MNKKWILEPNYTESQLQKLFLELSAFSKSSNNDAYLILAKLLLQREISTVKEAVEFNNFKNEKLHDPFLMLDMDKAVPRIISAIETNEKIMVFGDYDVDRTTSVALMVSFLQGITTNLIYYIPDRYNEGYGISIQGIDTAKEKGASLIIALDCGIKAIDKIDYANTLNIDFIICDHHTPGDNIPNAVAILDPKQKECKYPYKELAGCGIGFKLSQAISQRLKLDPEPLSKLVDLVAISIACDIVPVTGENRVLASQGLQLINNEPRPSITALLGEKEPNKRYNISDLVFQAGPKINAAGRISSGKEAVDLLLATSKTEITNFADSINQNNIQRKEKDKRITEEALEIINNNPSLHHKNSTVLYNAEWHKGVIGIVASRVIEKYYRPTVILTKSKDDIIGGSVRSVKGFDVYKALEGCSNEMIQFGGHKYAAGLTLHESQLDAFINKFEEVVSAQMDVNTFMPIIKYDAEINLEAITKQLKGFIDKLEPFGPQNMTPTFVSKNLITTGKSRVVGADGLHLKLELKPQNANTIIQGIAFNFGHLAEEIVSGAAIDIAYSIDMNYWKNTETLQLMVKDIKFSDKK